MRRGEATKVVSYVDEELDKVFSALDGIRVEAKKDALARKATCDHIMYAAKSTREDVTNLCNIIDKQREELDEQKKQIDVLKNQMDSMYNLFDDLSQTTFENTHWSVDGEYFTLSEIVSDLFGKLGLAIIAEGPRDSVFEIIELEIIDAPEPKEEE